MRTIIVLVCVALLVGCESRPQPPVTTPHGVTVPDTQGAASVHLIVLSDGTRCAALVGYYRGSISCDWK